VYAELDHVLARPFEHDLGRLEDVRLQALRGEVAGVHGLGRGDLEQAAAGAAAGRLDGTTSSRLM
jgi:hypothetical protein